jgi:hypothetical protein
MSGVESKGDPRAVGSTWSAAAIECLGRRCEYLVCLGGASVAYDASNATTASGPKPASMKRSSMVSTSSASYTGVCQLPCNPTD